MRSIFIILLLGIFTSCSNLSKNMVSRGSFSIKSGAYKNMKWNDQLKLERVSWYTEFNMLFDLIYGRIDKSSKFYNWFSLSEIRRIEKCEDLILSISYSSGDGRISQKRFESQMRQFSYEKIIVTNFTDSLKTHPDYNKLSLSLYKTYIYCRESKKSSPVYINFPNFTEVKL